MKWSGSSPRCFSKSTRLSFRRSRQNGGVPIVLAWIMANVLALVPSLILGIALATAFYQLFDTAFQQRFNAPFDELTSLALTSTIVSIPAGIIFGIGQWFVISRYIKRPSQTRMFQWIYLTLGGTVLTALTVAGLIATEFWIPPYLRVVGSFLLPLFIPIMQWVILRTSVKWASLWIVSHFLLMPLSLAIGGFLSLLPYLVFFSNKDFYGFWGVIFLSLAVVVSWLLYTLALGCTLQFLLRSANRRFS